MSKRKQGRPPANPPAAVPTEPVSNATVLLFGPSILLGAMLLFAVQPLIARYILPWFGGGPGVWTTCMLFFQALLLLGYLYAHVSVKYLPMRRQVALHLLLLIVALTTIPIIPSGKYKPVDASEPIGRILLLLGLTIGLPYFVLSATSPLLQAWFVKTKPNASPYRLFALSNVGSLLALLGYPIVLEPLFTRNQQAWIWSIGLMGFAISCLVCAVYVWRIRQPVEPIATAAAVDRGGRVSVGTIALWIALPMVASLLLLAITNTLTEDVASIPLLWIIPLTLYLLTFIIAFDSPRWYPRRILFPALSIVALWLLRLNWLQTEVSLLERFIGYSFCLFALCLFCHGELARRKPATRHLTTYYLCISVGGAIGGVLVAVVAPNVFNRLLELPLGVVAAAVLTFACLRGDPITKGKQWALLFAAASLLVLLGPDVIKPLTFARNDTILARTRNFYGTLMVSEFDASGQGDPRYLVRAMNHGTTSHGTQFQSPEFRHKPTLYYTPSGGAGLTLDHFPKTKHRRVGLVGLGVGTLAAYGKAGDTYRFYEINPDVVKLAREYFTYLSDSPASVEIVLGDARLALERENPQHFDIMVLDAFSGDSIPTHLLTSEAFDLYQHHLAGDGVIAVHISNRSVDLIQVILRQAERTAMSYLIVNENDKVTGELVSRWMMLTRNQKFLSNPEVFAATRLVKPNPAIKIWTDEHVNLLQVLHFVYVKPVSTKN